MAKKLDICGNVSRGRFLENTDGTYRFECTFHSEDLPPKTGGKVKMIGWDADPEEPEAEALMQMGTGVHVVAEQGQDLFGNPRLVIEGWELSPSHDWKPAKGERSKMRRLGSKPKLAGKKPAVKEEAEDEADAWA